MDAATEEGIALQQVVLMLGEEHAIPLKDLRGMADFRRQTGVLMGRLVGISGPLMDAFMKESARLLMKGVKQGLEGKSWNLEDIDFSALVDFDLNKMLADALPILMGIAPTICVRWRDCMPRSWRRLSRARRSTKTWRRAWRCSRRFSLSRSPSQKARGVWGSEFSGARWGFSGRDRVGDGCLGRGRQRHRGALVA